MILPCHTNCTYPRHGSRSRPYSYLCAILGSLQRWVDQSSAPVGSLYIVSLIIVCIINCRFLSFLLDTLKHVCQVSSMRSSNTGAIWTSYTTWPFLSAWSCHPNPIKTDVFPNCCIAISTTPLSSRTPCFTNSIFVSVFICLCSLNNVAILYKSRLMASK